MMRAYLLHTTIVSVVPLWDKTAGKRQIAAAVGPQSERDQEYGEAQAYQQKLQVEAHHYKKESCLEGE